MYQTMQLWVQEPMLHDAKLYLPALPQQYQAERLLQLFQNQKVGKHTVECTRNIYRWHLKKMVKWLFLQYTLIILV